MTPSEAKTCVPGSMYFRRFRTSGRNISNAGPGSMPVHEQAVQWTFAPDRNEEYFLYQTLWVFGRCGPKPKAPARASAGSSHQSYSRSHGAHPLDPSKPTARRRAEKVSRPESLLPENRNFSMTSAQFQKKIAYFGMVNALSQTLLKIAVARRGRFLSGIRVVGLASGRSG